MYGNYKESEKNFMDGAQYDISNQMKLPRRINANGETLNDSFSTSSQNHIQDMQDYNTTNEMNVPERIIFLGQNKFMGTKSLPRPIEYDNSTMSKVPSDYIRVQTPPRVITLSEHSFPIASQDNSPSKDSDDDPVNENELLPAIYIRTNGSSKSTFGFEKANDNSVLDPESQVGLQRIPNFPNNADDTIFNRLGGTPEQIIYMKRQMAKMNRRILSLEISNQRNLHKEKFMYCLGLAYFVIKAILWLKRS